MIVFHDCEMNLIRLFHKLNCESLLFSVGFRALMSRLFVVIYLFPWTVESLKTVQCQFLVGESYVCGNVTTDILFFKNCYSPWHNKHTAVDRV